MDQHRSSRRRAPAWAAILAIAAAALVALPAVGAQAATRPQTVVSLTFDDGNANQATAVQTLDRLGMKGTFYIPSGFVGGQGYLTLPQLQAMAANGHEIGGHTVSHPDLTAVSDDEAARQICDDRVQLMEWGFDVRSFAYPFASYDASTEQQAQACGYNSARPLGDLRSPSGCGGCPSAETIPPADPYATRALAQVETSWTLAQLKAAVTRAERTGGWVQFTFHNVCASGCDIAVKPKVFADFTTWLAARAGTMNTVVKTVGEVVGGTTAPPVPGPRTEPPGPGQNGVVNPSFANVTSGTPDCWMRGGYGANTAVLDTVSPGRTDGTAARVTVSGYQDGDAKWLPQFDLGACSPGAEAGTSYRLSSWYTSTGVTQFAVYLRDAGGAWRYWTSSPWFDASGTWAQASWPTPLLPEGTTGISFGLNLFSNGTLVVDDVAMEPVQDEAAAQRSVDPGPSMAAPLTGPVEVHDGAPDAG